MGEADMEIPIYQVDAFAERLFGGNPAAVCPLQAWLPDATLQAIALENNLSETAFTIPLGPGHYHLRWFTPLREVDLCGHATLATAHVLFRELGEAGTRLRFESRSGELVVSRDGDRLVLDFPAQPPQACEVPDGLLAALGGEAREVWFSAEDYIVVYGSERAIRELRPDFSRLAQVEARGIAVTAAGSDGVDFVSRFFAPRVGINEDPVTGSAHCKLAPLWSERLGKEELLARQLSARGGELHCRLAGERVLLAGKGVSYLKGWVTVPAG
jgi:PhzF family phenazine biosynthesis protein